MVNKVFLVGNLGKDPELRNMPNGQAVANFSIATSRKFKGADGTRQEKTEWHNIVVYGKSAEIAGQYLTKGKMVCVEGRIEQRTWDDKTTGEKRYKTEIVCEDFTMLGGGQRDGGDSDYTRRMNTPPAADRTAARGVIRDRAVNALPGRA
jgi:single-strand DNA-binding protein